MTHTSRAERQLILGWITSYGPFMDDDRLEEPEDYFEFEGHDVTDQGLGEAARRVGAGELAGTFSFGGAPINFEREPLTVQHGLVDDPIKFVDVPNVWDFEALRSRAVDALGAPNSWQELIELCRIKYDRIRISDGVLSILGASPFYPSVSNRVIELLRVLQEYMEHRRPDGGAGARAQEIYQQYFTGARVRFSDEFDSNKHAFRKEMTFGDPDNLARELFCPWHGKIQTPQFRIHFEWPIPARQGVLKVPYIGPKITKQ